MMACHPLKGFLRYVRLFNRPELVSKFDLDSGIVVVVACLPSRPLVMQHGAQRFAHNET